MNSREHLHVKSLVPNLHRLRAISRVGVAVVANQAPEVDVVSEHSVCSETDNPEYLLHLASTF